MKTFPAKFRVLVSVCLVAYSAYLSAQSATPKPLPVPKLQDLIQPWIFVRASEASTLFIDESFKDREPYGHLVVLGEKRTQWLEFDGKETTLWDVTGATRNEKELTLRLVPTAGETEKKPSRLVIYPYWDIDHCLVMIRFDPGAEENPVRFSTPYSLKDDLPHLAPEE